MVLSWALINMQNVLVPTRLTAIRVHSAMGLSIWYESSLVTKRQRRNLHLQTTVAEHELACSDAPPSHFAAVIPMVCWRCWRVVLKERIWRQYAARLCRVVMPYSILDFISRLCLCPKKPNRSTGYGPMAWCENVDYANKTPNRSICWQTKQRKSEKNNSPPNIQPIMSPKG